MGRRDGGWQLPAPPLPRSGGGGYFWLQRFGALGSSRDVGWPVGTRASPTPLPVSPRGGPILTPGMAKDALATLPMQGLLAVGVPPPPPTSRSTHRASAGWGDPPAVSPPKPAPEGDKLPRRCRRSRLVPPLLPARPSVWPGGGCRRVVTPGDPSRGWRHQAWGGGEVRRVPRCHQRHCPRWSRAAPLIPLGSTLIEYLEPLIPR